MAELECIPNISEGRRSAVVDRMARACERPGVALLDRSSDRDHHRSVFTLAGSPEPLLEALLELYRIAVAEIDLTSHGGVHPRIGAVDVVPFVPLGTTAMEVATETARRLAEKVGRRFDLPVFLYENAATRPERRDLAALRRGGLAGVESRMARPDGDPDFGPRRLHPTAGATAIGSRFFLIAFNVVLSTEDLALARRIAREVRESSGGLPAVKAIGLSIASRCLVQVSMNLVDYRQTSIARALAEVTRLAHRAGVGVADTEIVGLVPRAAAQESPGLVPEERILESRLEGVAIR